MQRFPAPQEAAVEQVPQAAAAQGERPRSPATLDSPQRRKRRRSTSNFSSNEHEDRGQQVAAESHPEGGQGPPGGAEQGGGSSQWQQEAEHLRLGALSPQSLSRRFSVEEKDDLLQWLDLQPARWTPERSRDPPPEAACPGFYLLTILGINRQISIDAAFYPVTTSDDPRAVGLPADPHGNTMLSCLSSGFICPLGVTAHPGPEELLRSAGELQDTHLVCVLDVCHLGGTEVEILLSKVYRAADVSHE